MSQGKGNTAHEMECFCNPGFSRDRGVVLEVVVAQGYS